MLFRAGQRRKTYLTDASIARASRPGPAPD